jgi:SulP family sulfate permease
MAPRVAVLSRDPDGTLRDAEVRKLETCRNISLIRFDGPLYFANTGYFEDKILERVALKPDLKFVIVDAEGINEIDATGEEMLHNLVERLKEAGVTLLIARAKKQLWDTFERTNLMEKLGRDHVFALRTQAFNYAWDQLGDNHAETCPLRVPRPLGSEAA